LGGRRVPVTRPRVRAADGSGELRLPSYDLFSSTEVLGQLAMEKMLAGLSSRRYPAGLEPAGQAVQAEAAAMSKSAVSRRFVAATETALAELMSRRLDELDLVALMIDEVHFGEHACVVALGIGIDGTKHPLAVENATLVTDLITGLRARPGCHQAHPGRPRRGQGPRVRRQAVLGVRAARCLQPRCKDAGQRAEPDPRDPRGVRHSLTSSVTGCGGSGAGRSAVVHCDRRVGRRCSAQEVRYDPLAHRFEPPGAATIRRVLEAVDAAALDAAVGCWLAARLTAGRPQPGPLEGPGRRQAPLRSRASSALVAEPPTGRY
jgi:hypothetical protein